jgi:hypothetical protein
LLVIFFRKRNQSLSRAGGKKEVRPHASAKPRYFIIIKKSFGPKPNSYEWGMDHESNKLSPCG